MCTCLYIIKQTKQSAYFIEENRTFYKKEQRIFFFANTYNRRGFVIIVYNSTNKNKITSFYSN